MSRFLRSALALCTGLGCVFALDTESSAQWARWEIGSGPWGGMRYRGPLLSLDIGGTVPPTAAGRATDSYSYGLAPAPVPPWHYRHDPPQAGRNVGEQERFYHQLDRTHRYRTGEERYAADFRDRYATGDPFYHTYHRDFPYAFSAPSIDHIAAVPGLSYAPANGQSRSFVPDAEVADLLRPAATRLLNSLSRKRDGAVWMKHLQPDRIIDAIDRAEFPGTLAELVEHYDGVSQNPRLVLIAEAEGFRDTQRLLSQYVLLQSRFATGNYPDQEYEVFMNAGQRILEEEPELIELNPAAQAPPQDQGSDPAGEIQYLPAPVAEPDPQR